MLFSVLLMVLSLSGDASQDAFLRRLQSKIATKDIKSPKALVRRLDTMPADCLSACPSLEGYASNMQETMMKHVTGSGDDMEVDMAGYMADVMGSMCTHKDALTCASNNMDVCSDGEEGGDDSMSPQGMANLTGCFCDACPGAGQAYGALMGEMMNMLMAAFGGDGEELSQEETKAMQDKMITVGCYMVGANECFKQNPGMCAAALEGEDDMFSGSDDDEGLTVEMCEQLGKSTDYKNVDFSGSSGSTTDSALPIRAVGALACALLSLLASP